MEELKRILTDAGFIDIVIKEKKMSDKIIKSWNFSEGIENIVFSAYIQATKPLNF